MKSFRPASRLLRLGRNLAFALIVTACTIDAYDKGEGELSLMRADLVLGFTDSERCVREVETDEGERLTLTAPLRMSWMERPDSAYRMALYYNKVEDHQAETVAFGRVGVVVPHHASLLDEVHHVGLFDGFLHGGQGRDHLGIHTAGTDFTACITGTHMHNIIGNAIHGIDEFSIRVGSRVIRI